MILILLLAALSSDPAVFVRSLYDADQRGATVEPLDFCQFATSRDGGIFPAGAITL